MIKAFLLFVCLVISPFIAAQTVYQGTVADKATKEPLDVVSVALLRADSLMIGYTYTNEKGNFGVSSPIGKEATYLSFSFMGYRTLILPVQRFKNNTTIFLENAPVQIREVKITSNRIKQSNDTLSYSVSGFKMPQDRTIEDVLKKIPGIEVTESGVIKFQDKPINKFYIEGMDLLEGKYTLASRNMSLGMVKEVQVLQSHQPIAALRGNSFSENAALNLVLTEDAKFRLIGTVYAGLGWNGQDKDLLWDNRILGMIFGKKMQNLSMYKNNNTGEDIAQEINPLIGADLFKVKSVHEESDFFASSNQTAPDIEQSRYLFNNAHLFTLNHLYKPSKPIDIRAQVSALHNETTFDNHSATAYFYPDNTIIVNEEEHSAMQHNKIQGELVFQLNDTSLYVRNTLSGTIGLEKKWYNLQVNNEWVKQQIRPERKNFRNSFELIRKVYQHSYSIYSDNSYFDLPQSMTVSPGLYAELLNGNEPYTSFHQLARLRSFQSHTYSYFQHKVAGFYLKYNVGLLHLYQKMNSGVELTENNGIQTTASNEFRNNLSFNQTQIYFEPTFNYKNYRWGIQFRLPLSAYLTKLETKIPINASVGNHKFLPQPSLNIKYDINAFWTISGLSSYAYSHTDIRQLYAGYLFTSYRSTSAYLSKLDIKTLLSNTLHLRFTNPLSGLFISINGFHNMDWSDVMHVYRNNDILSWTETVHHPHRNVHWGIGSRISKTLSWCKLYTALSGTYSRRTEKQLLNNSITPSAIQYISLSLDVSLQPNKYVNFQTESRMLNIYSKLDYPGYSTRNTTRYSHQLSANIIPNSNWRIKCDNTISHNPMSNKQITYFADLSVSYIYKKIELQLYGRNIFNNNSLEHTYLSNFTETFVHYSLRPHEILAKVLMSFEL
ncbi:carboxypeptidase-like regulatory domain-containing protein [Bacteroides sp. 519]|uniref:carboxypeptidase-like regulatory domain-containing protein n=1 Tax=Bacteroides sp. 519 TaxID=2302937 RepID=UPI0013D6552F|nr:carboxypeptidase-like regulatory domain-containing protein [Bacteroides sp. 519]NDV57500.1 hypothetical protein [Bacteroides sp. 519]